MGKGWKILTADGGIKLENNKKALADIQTKINEGKSSHKKYQEELIAYAKSVSGDKNYAEKVHKFVVDRCGGGKECISGATKLLEGTSHPLGKGYTSNTVLDKDIRSGKLPTWVIDPGSDRARRDINVGDILQSTEEAYTKTGKQVRGHPYHAMPIVEADKDIAGNFTSLKYFGNKGIAKESTDYHDIIHREDLFSNPNTFQVLKPNFIPNELIQERDSLKRVIEQEDPMFGKPATFVPRYTDYSPLKLKYKSGDEPGIRTSLKERRIEKMYQPLLDNQEALMQKYNLSNDEFSNLVQRLEGIGHQESNNDESLRYSLKNHPIIGKVAQFAGKMWRGDKDIFDKDTYSQGPWQVKPKYVPKDSKEEQGSVEEAFSVLADRYRNQVPSKYRGTDYGYGLAVNRYKGIAHERNEYLKNVTDEATKLKLNSGNYWTYSSSPYEDYKEDVEKKNPTIKIKKVIPGQSVDSPDGMKDGGKVKLKSKKSSDWKIID
jgi:hypothetical protein